MTDSVEHMQPEVLVELKTVGRIFDRHFASSLCIPDYQRHYQWQVSGNRQQHNPVLQLLSDIRHGFDDKHEYDRKSYRLGTLVLFRNPQNQLEIVDGQQRLITLALLLHALGAGAADGFLQQKIRHGISRFNIRRNYEFILNWLEGREDNQAFREYVLQKCELVCVELDNLDEAFQFFDAQNSKGKSLQPYDLLKAYHLREMANHHPKLLEYVENWERSVREAPNLELIINRILYCLRQWLRGEYADIRRFGNRDLPLFKGVSEQDAYPYLNAVKAALNHEPSQFQIGQVLLNGQRFFEFVECYRRKYRELFDAQSGKLALCQSGYGGKSMLEALNYPHCNATGDQLVRNLFECAVLLYYDKFGDEGLDAAVNRALHWAYGLRLAYERIQVSRINEAALDKNGLIRCILLAHYPHDVAAFPVEKVQVKYPREGLKELLGYGQNEGRNHD